ncbi:hypothetical protein NADFUDRAFT_53489 [Nadsonia fulvescens var. elongata DSM 6958]|uniref:Transcription initiation factor TFIID subunit 2 n=1 Tax=Nadsonia fulvescens var. elongata DSM 6958 TaxID=857566 RepID=A0A1E3PCT1_9ASCO|nr:hypothetical protein NADFUDRAFT_53489 [Nadsonia fulvescens var. elongata DSM 6958]
MSSSSSSSSEVNRGFHVAHQYVAIDVDLDNWIIRGWTEILVVPTDPLLKVLKFDCRQATVLDVSINNRKAQFTHEDNFSDATLFPGSTANQYQMYQRMMGDVLQERLPGELMVSLPRAVKVVYRDPSQIAGLEIPSNSSSKHSSLDFGIYAPLSVRIDFEVIKPIMGFNFIGGAQSNIKKSFWHAYTTNSPMGVSTSSWLPCIDGLWERCTWQLDISIPRTIKDLGTCHKSEINELESKYTIEPSHRKGHTSKIDPNETNGETESITPHHKITESPTSTSESKTEVLLKDEENDQDNQDEEDEEDEDRDIIVACSNLTPKEVAHVSDSCKKTVSFSINNPVSANYVGFAVGPFVQTSLPNLRDDEDEVDPDSANKAPVGLFSLVDRVTDTSNACIFIYRAMEYFCREYGSFPFSSLALVFVSDMAEDYNSMAGLAMCSDKLVFPPEVIEPLFSSTEILASALSSQWCSVNIIPKTWNDLWITTGLSHFMTGQFIRKLLGNNEYRFKLKKKTERICDLDIGRPPIADPMFNFPINQKELEFITLKAPVVLFILDRRMTKTDKSFGLSRVIPKIFLQALSGDLSNSALSTQHFIKVCEKVSYHKLDSFFQQWVFGSGYPIFRVTQRFNKKRMFIEMGIRQVQMVEIPPPPINESYFVDDAKNSLQGKPISPVQPVFQGPMTIRIHEADGTPYEHVVDLKESFTKLDIQYNTKYKRLKRNQREKSHVDLSTVDQADDADLEGVLLHCLGDVLQTDEEIEEWKLTDWTKEEEDRMTNEAFEWIRVDADFEWICKLYINQPDYMFASQLQQDRDVVAQYESVVYFSEMKPSKLYSSILTRTLMDKRYYYGIRSEVAYALAKMTVQEIDFIGTYHLIKAFQEMFCFEGSTIPDANNFSDFPNYFIQKSIPKALSTIRDSSNECPSNVKNFLLDLLRYNENSSNAFSDCYYVCDLIQSIVMAYPKSNSATSFSFNNTSGSGAGAANDNNKQFITKALSEIERYQRLDGWIPSYHNMVTIASLRGKEALVRAAHFTPKFEELIQYTRSVNNSDVRLCAFQIMLNLGALKNKYLLHYMFTTAALDPSPYIRYGLIESFSRALGVVALHGDFKQNADDSARFGQSSMMIVEEGSSNPINARRELIARSSISGALKLLKQNLGTDNNIKKEIWDAINSPLHNVLEKRTLLNICSILYDAKDSYMVHLPTPRPKKLAAKHLGNGKLVIKREGRFKLHMLNPTKNLKHLQKTKDASGNGENVSPLPALIIKAPKSMKTEMGAVSNKAPVISNTTKEKAMASAISVVNDNINYDTKNENSDIDILGRPRKILKISLPKKHAHSSTVPNTSILPPSSATATVSKKTTISSKLKSFPYKKPLRIITYPAAPSQVKNGTAIEFKGPQWKPRNSKSGVKKSLCSSPVSTLSNAVAISSLPSASAIPSPVVSATPISRSKMKNADGGEAKEHKRPNSGEGTTLKFKFKEPSKAPLSRSLSPASMNKSDQEQTPMVKKPKLKIKFKAPHS